MSRKYQHLSECIWHTKCHGRRRCLKERRRRSHDVAHVRIYIVAIKLLLCHADCKKDNFMGAKRSQSARKTLTKSQHINVEQFSCFSGPLYSDRSRQCKLYIYLHHTRICQPWRSLDYVIFHFSAYFINVANGWHKLYVSRLLLISSTRVCLTFLCLHLQHTTISIIWWSLSCVVVWRVNHPGILVLFIINKRPNPVCFPGSRAHS
jgi:hypothetical protein